MIKKGVIFAIATAVISGISIFTNAIIVSKTDPLIFTLIRNAVVAVFLMMVLVARGDIRKLGTLTKRQWGLLILIGAIGGGIPFALFFTGLAKVGALNGNIIQKTLFLWVLLLAVPILHERVSKVQVAGYLALFLGMFVFGGTFRVVPTTGTFLILAATICWAIENVIAKFALKTIPAMVVSWGRMMFGLPFLLMAVGVVGKIGLIASPASYAILPILASSLLLTLYVATWYSALSMAPVTLVSSILVFAPVVTALLTGFILNKIIFHQQAVNLLLLSVGAVLIVIELFLPKKQKESL
ncbi:MAG TPA: DMT family transporter [Patescibacteria group bacterium]|nr:DMT family transporter [Patescibacteria group bacterium]